MPGTGAALTAGRTPAVDPGICRVHRSGRLAVSAIDADDTELPQPFS